MMEICPHCGRGKRSAFLLLFGTVCLPLGFFAMGINALELFVHVPIQHPLPYGIGPLLVTVGLIARRVGGADAS